VVLIGFGTRYAGGCTSDMLFQALPMVTPSKGSDRFFVGGLIMTYLIYP
jgi:uncharacterized membrane protein YedE/YeeE